MECGDWAADIWHKIINWTAIQFFSQSMQNFFKYMLPNIVVEYLLKISLAIHFQPYIEIIF